MSSTTNDLDTGRREALQGLLSSLDHANSHPRPSSDVELSAEQLRKLSKKIDEILGDELDHGPTRDQPRQLRNEDDLPIVDISEPLNEDSQARSNLPPSIPEQEFIPFSLLPPDEKERQRRERERILDLLEEEERLQQLQEERDAEEERKEAVRKREESAKAKLEQLKAARKLQKKMGRALVQRGKGSEANRQEEDTHSKPQFTSPVAKKSVSFADSPATEADTRDLQTLNLTRQSDWGHVAPSRLRGQSRIPLVSAAEGQEYPMKMHVVERRPTADSSPFGNNTDSDDESPSGRLSPHSGKDSSDEADNNSLDDEPLDEEFDHDAAQHHREIALEYHKKWHTIGAEAAKTMATHTPDDCEQQEVPRSNGQLPLSRFRTERMATAYDKSHGPVSMPVGQNITLAFREKSLRNSVRLGNLENDQLVGGYSGESGSEDETIREVIQMLQTGNIQNIGPDFEPSLMSVIAPHLNPGPAKSTMAGRSTAARRVKLSRFKLAHGGSVTEGTLFEDDNSSDHGPLQRTVSSVVERKAPQ